MIRPSLMSFECPIKLIEIEFAFALKSISIKALNIDVVIFPFSFIYYLFTFGMSQEVPTKVNKNFVFVCSRENSVICLLAENFSKYSLITIT